MEKFCSSCGNELKEEYNVCPRCGKNLKAINFNDTASMPTSTRSKVAAGIFAILLGTLGVHNFYLGYTGKGVAQLLITLLSCGIGASITGIWALIEGILILCGKIDDAEGKRLSD